MTTKSSPHDSKVIRIGTRGSRLALAQSGQIVDQLVALFPDYSFELVVISTTGDRIVDRPLSEVGGKGLFVKELELAMLDGRIDAAVHSMKDVPVTMPLVAQTNLIIAAVSRREDVRDALLVRTAAGLAVDTETPLEHLPVRAKVGTTSPRRALLLHDRRPDLVIFPLRGNIDSRIDKLRRGDFDAIVLAMAGLNRLRPDLSGILPIPLDEDEFVPSAGQGALALECRRDDERVRNVLLALNDRAAEIEVRTEREVVRLLEGDCHSPIGVLARVEDLLQPSPQLHLRLAAGETRVRRSEARVPVDAWEQAAEHAVREIAASDHS